MAQSLFGLTPQQIMEARQLQQEQAINQQAQSFGMFGPLYAASRGLSQTGINALAQGLFPEAQDPALRRATTTQAIVDKYKGQNINDPSVLNSMALEFSNAGLPDLALQIGEKARALTPKPTRTTVAPGASVIDEEGNVIFTAPKEDKDTIVKTPANFAAAAQELGFGVKPNLGDYTTQEATAINNLLQTRGEKIQAAGRPAPPSGRVPIPDLKTATNIVQDFTGDARQRLGTVQQLRVELSQAKQGTGAALPQVRRNLVKLVGDNQIGQNEVQQALGSIGIVGDTISGINQLFTGVPTKEKLADVEKFINALEDFHAKSYNQSRERVKGVLAEGALNEKTIQSLIPPEYKTKPKTPQFQAGKVYKDAKGNRARYEVDANGKGKWVPVQ
jgi:hypothetical protein